MLLMIMVMLIIYLYYQRHQIVLTLSVRENKKLSKHFSKRFEGSDYWNEYKTKRENKNTIDEYRYFLESNFVRINSLFALVYTNQDASDKRFNARKYYLLKSIIKN